MRDSRLYESKEPKLFKFGAQRDYFPKHKEATSPLQFSQAGWEGVLRRSFPGSNKVVLKYLCFIVILLFCSPLFIIPYFLAYQCYISTLYKHKMRILLSFMKRVYHFVLALSFPYSLAFLITLCFLFFYVCSTKEQWGGNVVLMFLSVFSFISVPFFHCSHLHLS